jgi:hypothetical protein
MMEKTLTIGDAAYTVTATESAGVWVAEARRGPTGMRIGPPSRAAGAEEAIARLTRWLEWQRDHEAALAALQVAEHEYQQTIAGSAFSSGLAEATEMQHECLRRVEQTRLHLEGVREAQPEI